MEVRLAETDIEVEAAQRLRYRVFYEEMSALPSPAMREARRDFDQFDAVCDHLLVVDRSLTDEDGQPTVVGTYRFMRDVDATRAGGFYTSTEYDISAMLAGVPAGTHLLELGRSCVLKAYRSKHSTMQLLWRGLMVYVTRFSIDLMFGCASFAGTDPKLLALPLSYLHHYHPMPEGMRVRAACLAICRDESHAEGGDRSERGAARLAAFAQGLFAGGRVHRRGRGDRPAIRHHRRVHLLPGVQYRRALSQPLRNDLLTARLQPPFDCVPDQAGAIRAAEAFDFLMPVGEVTLISVSQSPITFDAGKDHTAFFQLRADGGANLSLSRAEGSAATGFAADMHVGAGLACGRNAVDHAGVLAVDPG